MANTSPQSSRQHRRLVAGAGADLQRAVGRPDLRQLGGARHHVGLRDGLAVADRQRPVVVGHLGAGVASTKRWRGTRPIAPSTRASRIPRCTSCSITIAPARLGELVPAVVRRPALPARAPARLVHRPG